MFAVLSTLLLAYWHTDLIRAIPTKNRLLHFYAHSPTTWNDANVICQNSGMALLQMDTEDVLTALKMFSANGGTWDGIFDDFWTGLHAYGDLIGPDDYVWSTCQRLGSYRPWRLAYERNKLRCVRGKADLTPGDSWETTDCSKVEGKVICQEVKDECSFRQHSNRKVRIHSTISETTFPSDDNTLCRTTCSTRKDFPECFGFYHNTSHCHLVLGDSYTQMGLVDSAGTTTYLKFCFIASYDTGFQRVPVFDTSKDVYPHTGCTSLDTPTTTTSPATTTITYAETTTTITDAETTTTAKTTTEEEATTESTTTSTVAMPTTPDTESTTMTIPTTITTAKTTTEEATTTDSKTTLAVAISTTPDERTTETTTQLKTFAENPTATACECQCRNYPNLTDEEKRDLIYGIIKNLTIDPSQVSANRRKYISIDDPRPSVKAVGGGGMALLTLAFGGVFFLDAASLGKDVMVLINKLAKCLKIR